MDKLELAAEPLFGLLTTLLMWWFLGDVLDTFNNDFLAVIVFGAAIIFTVVWMYDLLALLAGRDSSGSADS